MVYSLRCIRDSNDDDGDDDDDDKMNLHLENIPSLNIWKADRALLGKFPRSASCSCTTGRSSGVEEKERQ